MGFQVQDLFDELLLWGVGLFVGWVLRSVLLVGRDIAHYNYLLLTIKLNYLRLDGRRFRFDNKKRPPPELQPSRRQPPSPVPAPKIRQLKNNNRLQLPRIIARTSNRQFQIPLQHNLVLGLPTSDPHNTQSHQLPALGQIDLW